jgi:hypothetical protein
MSSNIQLSRHPTHNLGCVPRLDDPLAHFSVVDLVEIDAEHSLLALAILVLLDDVPLFEHRCRHIVEHERLRRRSDARVDVHGLLHGAGHGGDNLRFVGKNL